MTSSLQLASRVLEGEDPRQFLKRVMPTVAAPTKGDYVIFTTVDGYRNRLFQPYSLTWYYSRKPYDDGNWVIQEELAARFHTVAEARNTLREIIDRGGGWRGRQDIRFYNIAKVKEWHSGATGVHFNREVVEGENPKEVFRQLPRKDLFNVGEEVIHGTGDTRDIMDACLDALKAKDKARFAAEISDHDVYQYTTLGEIHNDFDPETYLYERLFRILQKYCPPFTYFDSNEADGSIGCWPPQDHMEINGLVDEGKLTYVDGDQYPEAAHSVMMGDFTGVDTQYVLVEQDGNMELWDKTRGVRVWKY